MRDLFCSVNSFTWIIIVHTLASSFIFRSFFTRLPSDVVPHPKHLWPSQDKTPLEQQSLPQIDLLWSVQTLHSFGSWRESELIVQEASWINSFDWRLSIRHLPATSNYGVIRSMRRNRNIISSSPWQSLEKAVVLLWEVRAVDHRVTSNPSGWRRRRWLLGVGWSKRHFIQQVWVHESKWTWNELHITSVCIWRLVCNHDPPLFLMDRSPLNNV